MSAHNTYIRSSRRGLAISAALVMLVSACSGASSTGDTVALGSTTTSGLSVTAPSTTDGEPEVVGGRGWLSPGDDSWSESPDSDGGLAYTESTAAPAVEDAAREIVSDGTSTSGLTPAPDNQVRSLQAGSINDIDDVVAYMAYRDSITGSGVVVRPLDLSGVRVVSVVGIDGFPILGAQVSITADGEEQSQPAAVLHTTADGTVRFFPGASTQISEWTVTVSVDQETLSTPLAADGITTEMVVDMPGGLAGAIPLDVHFLIDATGSMQDEIDRLRDNMAEVARRIDELPSTPDVRFGLTVYRDLDDLFVTRTFDLTDDLDSFLDALELVAANGGGDYPEALDEALADALAEPAWRGPDAIKLLVLIADAPPQISRQVGVPYTDSVKAAANRGVKILPIAASGTDDQAEYVMREMAFATGGRFVFMSYGVGGAATGGSTDITPDRYDELPLDQLVVRLVEDEILALTNV